MGGSEDSPLVEKGDRGITCPQGPGTASDGDAYRQCGYEQPIPPWIIAKCNSSVTPYGNSQLRAAAYRQSSIILEGYHRGARQDGIKGGIAGNDKLIGKQ